MRKLAAVALVALTVTACGGPAPTPKPVEVPSSSAPASSGVASNASPSGAPTLPPAARGTSKQAAIAFVKYWIEVLNYASDTGDADALREISTSACDTCATIARLIDNVYEGDGRIEGTKWSIVESLYVEGQSPRTAVMNTVIKFAPQEVYDSPDAKPRTFKGRGNAFNTFTLKDVAQKWRVDSLVRGEG